MSQLTPYIYTNNELIRLEKLVRTQRMSFIDVEGERMFYNAVFWLGEKEATKFMGESQ